VRLLEGVLVHRLRMDVCDCRHLSLSFSLLKRRNNRRCKGGREKGESKCEKEEVEVVSSVYVARGRPLVDCVVVCTMTATLSDHYRTVDHLLPEGSEKREARSSRARLQRGVVWAITWSRSNSCAFVLSS
jgi:hypothetical protein